jgi:membrane associated rhomboid family serine protease
MNNSMPSYSVTNPPSSLVIIGVCAILFFFGRELPVSVALWPLETGRFEPWQLITYGFFHGSFGHLFFNMFAVWMFGLVIEQTWGTRRFLLYYFTCLLAAAVTQLVVLQITGENNPTVGASGAVFGLLLAYGVMYPNNKVMLIFLPVPIAAKWFVLIYGALELTFGLTGFNPSVAHFAHLGGLFGGAALLWSWGWRPGMTWKR